eukprot:976975-Rhodomonas_salina.1
MRSRNDERDDVRDDVQESRVAAGPTDLMDELLHARDALGQCCERMRKSSLAALERPRENREEAIHGDTPGERGGGECRERDGEGLEAVLEASQSAMKECRDKMLAQSKRMDSAIDDAERNLTKLNTLLHSKRQFLEASMAETPIKESTSQHLKLKFQSSILTQSPPPMGHQREGEEIVQELSSPQERSQGRGEREREEHSTPQPLGPTFSPFSTPRTAQPTSTSDQQESACTSLHQDETFPPEISNASDKIPPAEDTYVAASQSEIQTLTPMLLSLIHI